MLIARRAVVVETSGDVCGNQVGTGRSVKPADLADQALASLGPNRAMPSAATRADGAWRRLRPRRSVLPWSSNWRDSAVTLVARRRGRGRDAVVAPVKVVDADWRAWCTSSMRPDLGKVRQNLSRVHVHPVADRDLRPDGPQASDDDARRRRTLSSGLKLVLIRKRVPVEMLEQLLRTGVVGVVKGSVTLWRTMSRTVHVVGRVQVSSSDERASTAARAGASGAET